MNDLDPIPLENSLKVSSKNFDISSQFQKLYELGSFFQSKRQYSKALIYARQALDLSNEETNFTDQFIALVNMGCVYWEMSQLKKAMMFYQDALSISEQLEDKEAQGKLCAIMGVSYWRLGEWSIAMNWFEKALEKRPENEINNEVNQTSCVSKYEGLTIIMERGIETLKNRIKIAKNQNNLKRILLPCFSMIPLVFFTGRKEEIPKLLETITSLARKLKNENILDLIPRLKKIMSIE